MLAGEPSSVLTRGSGKRDCSPVVLAHEHSFAIGEAEFRPATREVLFGGRTSVIEPRVMQLLVALHRAGGAVVAKDDLAAMCWEARIVGEDAINRVVSRLRSVAEKQAGGQFRLETITKVGYRLIPAAEVPDAREIDEPAPEPGKARVSRRELVVGGSVVGLLAAGALGWAILQPDSTPSEARLLIDDARKSLMGGDINSPLNAVGTLRRATEIAPNDPEAWGLLAYAYMIAASAAGGQDTAALGTRGVAAMRRAFALDPRQGDALAARLWTIPTYGNWVEHERACRQALQYHPGHPALRLYLAEFLCKVGRVAEALPLINGALKDMPRSAPVLIARSGILWALGRLEEADAAIANAFDMLPRNSDVWASMAMYLMYNNRGREALAMLADPDSRPSDLEQHNVDLLTLQARALTFGDKDSARKAIDIADQAARDGKGYIVVGSMFAAFIGDLDEAFVLLDGLYFDRGFRLPGAYLTREQGPYVGHERGTAFLFDRRMTRLRRDPRFATLTRDIGLGSYWDRTGTRALVIA